MLKTVALMTLAVAFISNAAYAEREFAFNKDNKFDGNAITSIKIDMPSGEISIVKSRGSDIEVFYKNLITADDQSEADKLNQEFTYKAEQSGEKLLVTVEPPRHHRHQRGLLTRILSGDWDENYYPIIKISVPDNKQIQISSASADIEAANVTCQFDIQSASSDINFENISGNIDCVTSSGDISIMGLRGSVNLKGNSSDIHLIDIDGDVDVQTSSGDSDIDKVKGSVDVSTASGDNRIFDLDGDLFTSSASGDIIANSVTGSVHAKAVSGDIKLDALSNAEGDFYVESVSGDIQMAVSRNFKGEIAVRSVSGSVNSDLESELESYSESRLRGNVGSGNGRLEVSTTSGDINIDKF